MKLEREEKSLNLEILDRNFLDTVDSDKEQPDTTEAMGHMLLKRKFVILGDQADAPLGMYRGDGVGIYTTNERDIERAIMNEMPRYSIRQVKEVYQKLTIWTGANYQAEPTHDKNLIPVANGIYNVAEKKLMPFSSKYLFTSKVATPYDPDAKEPTVGPDDWKPSDWIMDLANHDQQVYRLFWQVIHASLNSSYCYRQAIFLVGPGNDGKGTLEKLLISLVGPKNTASLKIDEFSDRFAIGSIDGKALVIGDEVQANSYLSNSSKFNSVVTGDPVTVERKNQQGYTTNLTPTIVQSTNEMPKFKNTTDGTYRRLVIVPFKHQFSKEEDNWNIKDDYVNRPEVLKWVLKNALENYAVSRFDMPDVSQQAIQELREESDPLVNFKHEVFDEQHPTRIPTKAVYHYYVEYQKMNNQRNTMGPARFTREFLKLIGSKYEKRKARITSTDWAFNGLFPNDMTEEELVRYVGTSSVQCFIEKKTPRKKV